MTTPLLFGSMYDPRFTQSYGWSFVYFHHAAEEVVQAHIDSGAPDLVASPVTRDSIPDGVHPCTVYEHPATLFLWTHGESEAIVAPNTAGAYEREFLPGLADSVVWLKKVVARHGLICLDNDQAALEYARRMYDAKQAHI